MSINKNSQSQNNFIIDVFELLDLDFEEYVNTVSKNLICLIEE